ncbi:MAG: PKD domain-containing protein, partial [Bacteroidota bacterium]
MRNRNSLLYKGIIASFFYLLIAADLYGQCSVNAGNDTTICQGQRFVRTATFTGSSSSIRWYNKSNPSNDLSTNATINIVRNVPGKDTIVIRVDGTGSNCPDTDTVVVTVNPSPSINIGANQTLCQNDVESITATFSPANGIINWYLLGSTTSSGTGPTFIIPTNSSGTFNYVAKIDSAGICSDFDTVRIVVDPRPNASFTFNPSTGCGRTRVTFTNTSNNGSGSTSGLSYNWNFGDGNTSTQTNPSHTFNPGRGSGNATFPVRLIVTNSSGCKDTSTININIGKTPDPTLNGPGSTIFNGQSYFKICASAASNFGFTNGSSTASTNTNYVIKWGDGTPDTSFNTFTTVVRHLYSVGSKKLTFIVYSGSCVDSTVYNVFVGNVPAGGLVGVGGSTICAGDAQNFVINGIAN